MNNPNLSQGMKNNYALQLAMANQMNKNQQKPIVNTTDSINQISQNPNPLKDFNLKKFKPENEVKTTCT